MPAPAAGSLASTKASIAPRRLVAEYKHVAADAPYFQSVHFQATLETGLEVLLKNGVSFSPKPEHAATIILSLAAGEVSEESLTRWIRENWPSE